LKISRNSLAFMSMLAAGLLLAGATVFVPSATSFGQETDIGTLLREAEKIAADEQKQAASQTPAQAPASQAPVPPAAPIDSPSAATPDSAGAGSTESPAGLPSAGSGGYLNAGKSASLGYLLMGLGATLIGSGSLVWAYSKRNR
jgi:hypothetical protein